MKAMALNSITSKLLTCVLGALLATSAFASPSSKWRIKCNHTAKQDGTVVLRLTPVDRAPTDIEIDIPKGTGENKAARLIRDAIKKVMSDDYKTETDDGEDVLVKKRSGRPNLDIEIVSNSAKGLTLKLRHE